MFIFKLIVGIIFNVVLFAILLLAPATTWAWWRAWVFLGFVCVGTVASTVSIFRSNRDVLNERLKPPIQQGQPLADKIVLLWFLATFIGLHIFIPLDVFRLHLLSAPGVVVSSLGLVLVVVGWWIISLALKENAFAAPVVKHQKERQQRVIDTGVYSKVRHPMYTGAVFLLVGLPLWLESYAAALLASIPIGTLAIRILIEEQFLKRELQGYDAYTKRIRYRLIPFLW
jgi:protein-S-isoprenylcysteine O-methyltransferase Ste14